MSGDESSDELEDRKSILEEGEREEDRERVEAFLHAICDEIDKNSLEMGGQRHRELAYLGNDVKIDVLIDIWDSTDERDCVRLSALFGYFSSGQQYREGIGHKVKKYEGEFGSHKLYQLSKFLCFSSSDHPPHLQEAFSNGVAVADKMDQNPRFHAQLAAVGVDLVRRSDTLVSNLQMDRIDESKILSTSAKYAEKAYKEDPDREFSTQVYASVLVRQQRYEEALEVIKSRLPESEQEDSLDPYRREGPVSEQISHVQREKQRYELDNLSNELVQVESELEKATEHYRNQVLQFMGFFAAILAVALSSVQLATQLSFPQSGGLVLILVGGITISFEELKYLFSSPSEDEKARSWSTIGVGFLLITIGIGVGYGFLNSLF